MNDWDRFLLLMAVLVAAVGLFYRFTRRTSQPEVRRRTARVGDARPSVLVLSAGLGDGHNAAARAVKAALEAAGHPVTTIDGLRQMSPTVDALLRWVYAALLNHAPWLYDFAFRIFALPGIRGLIRRISGLLYGGRLLRIVDEVRPDLVVSTYPVVTATLGYLRLRGKLPMPTAAIVSDFGVHPMWVAPGIDQHLVVSSVSVAAARAVGSPVQVVEPLIGPEFREVPDRAAARSLLGLPREGFVALIVGGAWGIGDLEGAAARALRAGVAAVIVCGHNEALREHLEHRFRAAPRVRVYGWTAEMPRLMAASDCLIQNAGGLTCLEAIHFGLPILIYEAIPGHGRLNAEMMERAGAAVWVRQPDELEATLRQAADGTRPLPLPPPEPLRPVAAAVLETLRLSPLVPAPARQRQPWVAPARRALLGATSLGLLGLLTFSSWSVALAARGLRMDVPGANPTPGFVAVGIRATDPQTARAVETLVEQDHLPVTIFVDQQAVAGLVPASDVSFGVAENPTASVMSDPWRVRQEMRAAAVALHEATGATVDYFLPARQDVNLTALAMVPPPSHLVIPDRFIGHGVGPGVYVIDVSGLPAGDAEQVIEQQFAEIHRKGLQCVSLAQLAS